MNIKSFSSTCNPSKQNEKVLSTNLKNIKFSGNNSFDEYLGSFAAERAKAVTAGVKNDKELWAMFQTIVKEQGDEAADRFLKSEALQRQAAQSARDTLNRTLNQAYLERKTLLNNVATGTGVAVTGAYILPMFYISSPYITHPTTLAGLGIAGVNAKKLAESLISPPDKSPEKIEKLVSHAKKGENTEVQSMIGSYISVNGTTAKGKTALQAAAKRGDTQLIEYLLDVGADVNQADSHQKTPLWHAARKGHASSVKRLIKAGAELDKNSDVKNGGNHSTPFWEAAGNGHLEPVTLLLQAGADKDNVNPFHGLTAMQRATRKGHSRVANYLLNQGAKDIDVENERRKQRAEDESRVRRQEEVRKQEEEARRQELAIAVQKDLSDGLYHGAKVAAVCVVVPAVKTAAAAALCTIQ
ncbi:ankyrin repeat domain-containing protein [Vampirovibrio sp.]|uniref:ankyrin repeat domain-containing protein n=1 Tax=Vampirovibrio sp. TaxID=2717857 RepID=UPI003592FF31